MVSYCAAGLCGAVGAWAGYMGYQGACMALLLVLHLADYATGLYCAARQSRLHAGVGLAGIYKKARMWGAVLAAWLADLVLQFGGPAVGLQFFTQPVLCSTLALWLAANEALSVLENLAQAGVPLPGVLERAAALFQAGPQSPA